MPALLPALSALAAALVWIYVAASVVRFLVPLGDRLFFGRVSELDHSTPPLLVWVLTGAMLFGCVTAWRILRVEQVDPGHPPQRSSLSVWPAWPLAIVGVLALGAVSVLSGMPAKTLFAVASQPFADDAWATVPLTLAAAAAVTGGRGNEPAAFLAAPMTLLLTFALIAEVSIVRVTAAACVPALVLAAGLVVTAFLTGRELIIWSVIGLVSVAFIALALATGLFTPLEVLAVVCALAVVNGLLIYTLVEGRFPWRIFAVGATEILAFSTVFVLAVLGAALARDHGVQSLLQAPLSAIPATILEPMAAAAMFVLGALLTPLAAMCLVGLAPVFSDAGPRAGLLITFAGMAAIAIRAIDWEPGTVGPLRLSPATGLFTAALLLLAVALTAVFWDAIQVWSLD